MADNDAHEQRRTSLLARMKQTGRHFSQASIPSNGLILKHLTGGSVTINAVRKRRTCSEQINRYDG